MITPKFEQLEIYRLAEKLSDIVWDIVIKWDPFHKRTVGAQYVNASDSVGANIAEGYGRGSKKDNARFAKIARASLFESKHWLIQSNSRRLLSDDKFFEFKKKIENLIPRISAYINYLLENRK